MVGWLLVVLCAAAGAYCLTRVRGTRERDPVRRQQARGEALMALGMAVMALPATAVVLSGWSAWVFAAVFGAAGVWAVTARHPHHAIGSLAMVYMALAMAAAGAGGHGAAAGHGAHGGSGGLPALTSLLLLYYAVHAVASGVRLIPAPAAVTTAGAPVPSAGAAPGPPRAELLSACRTAMSMAMFTMLLTV